MTELKQSLSLKQTLQLVMTPQLQQAIKLLQLSRLELSEVVHQEMLENPVLEESPEAPEAEPPENTAEAEALTPPTADEREASATERVAERMERSEKPEEVKGADGLNQDIDWEKYLEDLDSQPGLPGTRTPPSSDELPSFENQLVRRTSLTDHLMWQLRMSNLSESDQRIGAEIILELNEDGYLVADDEDRLAGRSPISIIAGRLSVPEAEVERVLSHLQGFDPVGVAARDLRESLLIQARLLGIENGLVYAIIESHLPEVERKNYPAIARALKVTTEQVVEAVRLIGQLEPKPGRVYSEDEPQYITPDIFVYKLADEYVVVLNEDGLPKLRISPYYRRALQNSGPRGETRDYIQDKLRSAIWLIRSIHQRQRTIYRVTESIVKFQREFFDKGISHLKPLVLRDVAEDLGLHESTISRVTTNKFVHTPQGIYELKFFFNSGISRVVGEDVASETVKEKIRQMCAAEDPKNPLSDREIGDRLREQNINIARRTVAKYRELLDILPSSKRRKLY
ncbi:MAG: RNA polymerase factor sigma-54 [Myxococcales bacterium]|nr:RNA polymerase factor sigma-54 [Myxococcales bacterium]